MKSYISILFVLMLAGCGSMRAIKYEGADTPQANTEKKAGEGVISRVKWFKIKESNESPHPKFDIQLELENKYEYPVSFQPNNWKLKIGDMEAVLLRHDFKKGMMVPGEVQRSVIGFQFKSPVQHSGQDTKLILDDFRKYDDGSKKLAPMEINFKMKAGYNSERMY